MRMIIPMLLISIGILSCQETIQKSADAPTEQSTDVTESTIGVLEPVQFYKQIEGEWVQLIDVRTREEFDAGHLEGAINYAVTDSIFATQVNTLKKDQPVYVYCKSGGRSARAALLLKDKGFQTIYDLEGGITAWLQNDLPIED